MTIDGRKNCLVAGMRSKKVVRIGTTTRTTVGMGAIVIEKAMRNAKMKYWMSRKCHL